jgi:glycosyltransferase involved in cell wall biosynthesis
MRVAMVTTHPIQYQVPWLRMLAKTPGIELHVYFAMIPDAAEQGREFGVAFDWDIPLLEGYEWSLLENCAKHPSLTAFRGCDTPQLYREIRKGGFDAVIVNGWVTKTCLQALLATRLAGIPCIVRGEVNGLRPRATWKRWLHARLLARYAACLAIGTNNRRYLLDAGVPVARIFATPYCVENERFSAAAEAARIQPGRDALQARFGLDPERTTFVFSGKFVDKKRPGDIIEAIRCMEPQERDRVQLLLVGGGPLEAELRTSAAGMPVHFAGFLNQSEITQAYAVADCMVLPSDHGETWGLVVNEAMACGLPVIVSDQVGCAVDLVQAGKTGDIFPCGDVAALSALLARHGGNRTGLVTMGAAARTQVCADYNFEHVRQGVLAALPAATGKLI